jgi:formimidoylglutamate deiminase
VTPDAAPPAPLLWAPQAWVDGRWQTAVRLRAGRDGCWAEVAPGQPCPPGAQVLPGAVLPALVNGHSHAFQRAFAALAETRDAAHDDFWSWRDRMYQVALRVTPAQLHDIAAHLWHELLAGGYTQVVEFHYLHRHAEAGAGKALDRPMHADADADDVGADTDAPHAMARALADAAVAAGIGLTLVPVAYRRAGFAQPALRTDQRRFACSVPQALALRERIAGWRLPGVGTGVGVHSLRAVPGADLHTLARALRDGPGPVHLHAAEQTAEVDDCLAATGRRPIEWLAAEGLLDARWHLVHATHATPQEIDAVAAAGAGIVLCPSTEGNLGDGIPDLPRWLAAGVPLALGTDSHVGRAWPEELRWLEYVQRLARRERNVAARPGGAQGSARPDGSDGPDRSDRSDRSDRAAAPHGSRASADPPQPATAARLLQRVLAGGAGAAGFTRWGLTPGARADLLVLDPGEPALAGVPPAALLDALVFAAPARPFAGVMAAGRWVAGALAGDAAARRAAAARDAFARRMGELWGPHA